MRRRDYTRQPHRHTKQNTSPHGARRRASAHIINKIGGAATIRDNRADTQNRIRCHTVREGAPMPISLKNGRRRYYTRQPRRHARENTSTHGARRRASAHIIIKLGGAATIQDNRANTQSRIHCHTVQEGAPMPISLKK